MSRDKPFNAAQLASVTVTYNPDCEMLRAQLRALPEASLKIVVDNASAQPRLSEIETLVARTANAVLVCNSENLGLAAATNQGVREAGERAAQTRLVLLLDQDTEPMPGSIEALVAGFERLSASGGRVGGVGPILRDAATGLTHGFHRHTRWRWTRTYPTEGAIAPVPCASLNGSGTLVPVDVFLDLGGLDESLFIDHVDTEWSFRLLAAGYGLWGIPQAVFTHRMGQASLRFWWFGWRLWPSRAPRRHYFLFRNAVRLMKRPYVPTVWKAWAAVKLALTACVHGLIDGRRSEQVGSMWAGIRDGLHSKADRDLEA